MSHEFYRSCVFVLEARLVIVTTCCRNDGFVHAYGSCWLVPEKEATPRLAVVRSRSVHLTFCYPRIWKCHDSRHVRLIECRSRATEGPVSPGTLVSVTACKTFVAVLVTPRLTSGGHVAGSAAFKSASPATLWMYSDFRSKE